jgi:thiazolylpeptide-type bacteriocin precursor
MTTNNSPLALDLNSLEIEEIQSFLQEGNRGMTDFAASCNSTNSCGTGSCSGKQPALSA